MTERPVECSQCKKPAKIIYKEIVSNAITCTHMCGDCPIYQQKIHGSSPQTPTTEKQETEAGLYCGKCHTSLESIKMGSPTGCSECYNIFSDVLVAELLQEDRFPPQMKKGLAIRKNQPLHVGKTPGKPLFTPTSAGLTALNEALNEALKKENYEQAALLRDQIKELMEKRQEDGTKPTAS